MENYKLKKKWVVPDPEYHISECMILEILLKLEPEDSLDMTKGVDLETVVLLEAAADVLDKLKIETVYNIIRDNGPTENHQTVNRLTVYCPKQ